MTLKITDLVKPCQLWPNTSFLLALSNHHHHVLTFLSRCARCPLALGENTERTGTPLASMTNARRPDVKLHVCLILNQTYKGKKRPWPCENLKIIGNTWLCPPIAPLWIWKKVSLLHVFQSLPTFTAGCVFIVDILVDIQRFLQNCQHVISAFIPTILLYASAGANVFWMSAMHVGAIHLLTERLTKSVRLTMMNITGENKPFFKRKLNLCYALKKIHQQRKQTESFI